MKNLSFAFLLIFIIIGSFAQDSKLTLGLKAINNTLLKNKLPNLTQTKIGIINPYSYLGIVPKTNLITKFVTTPYQGIPSRSITFGHVKYLNVPVIPALGFWINNGRVIIDSRYAAGITHQYNYTPTKSSNLYLMIGKKF